MASKKRWVVFGASEHANKALIGFKGKLRGIEVRVCELKDEHYKSGDVPEANDIDGEYITMYFTTEESVDRMIYFLQSCKKFFRGNEDEDTEQ